MAAQHITDAEFEEIVLNSETPVLVDFFAEWCGPCKMAAPVLDELAGEYEGKVKIVKMDVDQNPQTPGKYGVMSIPTVVMVNKKDEVDRKVGFGGKQGYLDMIAKVLEQ